jgi:integrase/recombinase XerC
MPFFVPMLLEFDAYLRIERRYSNQTVSSYISDLTQFETYMVAQYDDHAVTSSPSSIRSWVSHLVEGSNKASTVHRKLSTLRAYYKFLQKRGVRTDNPAKGIPKPKKKKQLPHFIEASAMSNIRQEAWDGGSFEDKTNQLMIRLLYETGMRQAELLGLSDGAISFPKEQLTVIGKRNKMRLIPVSRSLIDELRLYLDERKKTFGETNPGTFLVTRTNKKITKSFVYRVVRLYLSDVTTAQKRSPHVLRHSFATHMLNNGADLNVIKEILGHSSLAATQVYTHNNIEKLRQVHQQMHPRNKS